jgi:hypothetical protein
MRSAPSFSYISEQRSQSLFSLGYALSFAVSDARTL